jgi:syntaxin-binding protein 1
LSFDDYPSVVPMPQQVGGSSGSAHSARKRRPEGSARRSGGATDRWQRREKPTASDKFEGGRVIVFVVGGMCFSELRVSREVMAKEGKEIIAGSTCFLKPSDFIEDIKNMA